MGTLCEGNNTVTIKECRDMLSIEDLGDMLYKAKDCWQLKTSIIWFFLHAYFISDGDTSGTDFEVKRFIRDAM